MLSEIQGDLVTPCGLETFSRPVIQYMQILSLWTSTPRLCPTNTKGAAVGALASLFSRIWHGLWVAFPKPMIRTPLLVCCLAALVPASATTLRRASLDDLIQISTSVIRGRVVGSSVSMRGG